MWIRVGALLLAMALMGCGATTATVDSQQVGPSPIVLKDTSPAQLSVSALINVGGYDAASRDRAVLDVFFQHGGRPVEFVGNEHIDCDGQALRKYRGGNFEAQFSSAAIAGREIVCTYVSSEQAQLSLIVPQMLAIVSPVENERVNRGPRTLVRYAGVLSTDIWVVALSPSAKAVAEPKDATASEAVLNTSTLGPGPGSINLTDPNNFSIVIQAPAFASVTGSARRAAVVDVLWI